MKYFDSTPKLNHFFAYIYLATRPGAWFCWMTLHRGKAYRYSFFLGSELPQMCCTATQVPKQHRRLPTVTCCSPQGLQPPSVVRRANHPALRQIQTARCNPGRTFFTTNINEFVTYKFFTSTIPRKAFLGIPFIWFSLRSLNKEREKKYSVLTNRNGFLKSTRDNGTYTRLENQMFLDLLHHMTFSILLTACRGLRHKLKWLFTKITRIHPTSDRTSRKHHSNRHWDKAMICCGSTCSQVLCLAVATRSCNLLTVLLFV